MKISPKEDNITDIPYSKAIVKIAIPAILSFICQILFEFVDAYWLGKLQSSDVFAAVGSASFITWALYGLMSIVSGGVNSFVAQYAGSGNKKRYQRIAFEGIILSIFFGIFITLVMLPLYHSIFILMGLKENILKGSEDFFLVINLGFVILFVYNVMGTIFNAHGDTKITLLTTLVPIIINIILEPFLILGIWFVPPMGVTGAALGTIIASLIGIFMRLYYLQKKDFLPKYFISISAKDCLRIIKIGVPVATGNFIFSMVFPFLTRYITMLNNIDALSALNICHRVEGIAYFVCVGFSVSASTMVGQYMGIRDAKKAGEAAWHNIYYITSFLFLVSLLFIFYPDRLISFMTCDKNILREGIKYLNIIGYFEIFLGLEIVFQGVFTGMGSTFYANLIYTTITIGRIPLAYFMAFSMNMGVEGIWWAISFSTLLKGLFVTILFLSNYWVKQFNTPQTSYI